ncbi:hypothetical protein GCM10007108_06330 [Thermogymnomonas acidicola]|uniref:Uncharacterized protein n=1 Tax=Thermogymnomonas acidicola TaxID=399579 RepID=A0AA37BQV6_9ARCH|nr:MqnA/MqnD/SBP family protein [Thermogymnomonas acidicola]GGM71005.1 hypothetical protein GCM10007108_06330 [Thermogymnomonas acidicola]
MVDLISFLHSEPLSLALREKCSVERYEPGRILERLLDGQARTGMVSLLAYMENRDALRLSRSASIHTAHTTMSTLLLGRGQGLRKSIEVAVTRYTRTTEFYLSLILRRLNVDFRLYRSDGTEAADLLGEREYALVIGDEALRAYSQGYSIVMDIGSEFSRLYNLAPLYAVTVSSDEAEEEILRQGVRDSDMHRLECVPLGVERGIRADIARRYLSLIRYDWSPLTERTLSFIGEVFRKQDR